MTDMEFAKLERDPSPWHFSVNAGASEPIGANATTASICRISSENGVHRYKNREKQVLKRSLITTTRMVSFMYNLLLTGLNISPSISMAKKLLAEAKGLTNVITPSGMRILKIARRSISI